MSAAAPGRGGFRNHVQHAETRTNCNLIKARGADMFPGLVRWNKHSHPRVSRGSRRNAGGRCKSKVLMRRVKTRQSGVLLGHCAVSPNETKSHQRLFLAKRCRMGRAAGVLSEPPPHPGRLQRVQPAKAPTRRRPGREAGLLLLGGGSPLHQVLIHRQLWDIW